MTELKEAMRAFGFHSGTVVTVRGLPLHRAVVSVSGKMFGIWDVDKATFVD